MALLKEFALKGLLSGAGAVASSAGVWQTHSGLSGAGWTYSPSDLLVIEEISDGVRLEKSKPGDCFNRHFKGTFISSQFKGDSNSAPASLETATYGTGDEAVDGCLLVDVKYRDRSNQKAISLATELALTKGNHGLFIWSTLNSLTNDPLMEKFYVVRLSKDTGNWKAEHGYAWISLERYNDLEIHFDNKKRWELDTQGYSSCLSGSENRCYPFTVSGPTENFRYSGTFKSETKGNERIFTKLKIKDKDHDNSDFWGLEDIFANTAKDRGFSDFTYVYSNGMWNNRSPSIQSTTTNPTNLHKNLQAWFKPFTDSKGTWTETPKDKN